MRYDTLGWSVDPVLQDAYDFDDDNHEVVVGQTLYAAVTPVVNGQPVNTPWTFDAVALLLRRDQGDYLFDPFTCGCGVAGCAGIHDYARLRVREDTVALQFPRQTPFPEQFVPAFFPDTQAPLVWTFEAGAYHRAMDDLVALFNALEADHPDVPVVLWPSDGNPSGMPSEGVQALLDKCYLRTKEHAQRIQKNRALWGPLYCATLRVHVEDSAFEIGVESFLDAASDAVHAVDGTENQATANEQERVQWLENAVVLFKAHPQELTALLKTLTWAQVEDLGYLNHPERDRLLQKLAAAWPNAEVTLVEYDDPEKEDWRLL